MKIVSYGGMIVLGVVFVSIWMKLRWGVCVWEKELMGEWIVGGEWKGIVRLEEGERMDINKERESVVEKIEGGGVEMECRMVN